MNFIRTYWKYWVLGFCVSMISYFLGYPLFDENGFYPYTALGMLLFMCLIQLLFDPPRHVKGPRL